MKIIIAVAAFTIIGLIASHLVANTYIREWEAQKPTHPDLIYPREYITSCYGGGIVGGLVVGVLVGGVASVASRRKASVS
jgi:ethanolamine utilization microcompartment shell protein EutL